MIENTVPTINDGVLKDTPRRSTKNGRKKKNAEAMKIVNKYVLLSGGTGLIPVPFFDQVAIGVLLAKMLSDLCQLYGAKFSDNKIEAIVSSVLGGAHSDWITTYIGKYLYKIAPGINMVGSVITRPLVSAAITYVIGKNFVIHFESGSMLKIKKKPVPKDTQATCEA